MQVGCIQTSLPFSASSIPLDIQLLESLTRTQILFGSTVAQGKEAKFHFMNNNSFSVRVVTHVIASNQDSETAAPYVKNIMDLAPAETKETSSFTLNLSSKIHFLIGRLPLPASGEGNYIHHSTSINVLTPLLHDKSAMTMIQ